SLLSSPSLLIFLFITPPPPTSTLFPYTTLFRSKLFRRSRHSLRRPLQVRQRPRPEFCRDRLALSTRIFPAGNRQGRNSARGQSRSEEHTSELQSPYDLVCRLLLEKKKKKYTTN